MKTKQTTSRSHGRNYTFCGHFRNKKVVPFCGNRIIHGSCVGFLMGHDVKPWLWWYKASTLTCESVGSQQRVPVLANGSETEDCGYWKSCNYVLI
ncbi:hypothetical protein HanRHA438_Chr17g0798501 [Helianthus annuus]|nr:hypothetical protein HanRHA438_Chr17g0798501 [Helianthus annuus]